jgi:hypothetical protein
MGPAPRTQDSAVDVAAQSAIYPANYSELARGESGRDSFPVVLCQNISTGASMGDLLIETASLANPIASQDCCHP